MSIHSKTTWLVVGDGAAAQFYAINAVPLRLTKVPSGTMKATHKTTRGPDHGSAAHKVTHTGNHHGDHQRHENVFVEQIAHTLAAAARDGEFDEIIVVLPPKALAHFRDIAGAEVKKRIKREIRGDWTHLTLPDLEKHLAAELP